MADLIFHYLSLDTQRKMTRIYLPHQDQITALTIVHLHMKSKDYDPMRCKGILVSLKHLSCFVKKMHASLEYNWTLSFNSLLPPLIGII